MPMVDQVKAKVVFIVNRWHAIIDGVERYVFVETAADEVAMSRAFDNNLQIVVQSIEMSNPKRYNWFFKRVASCADILNISD